MLNKHYNYILYFFLLLFTVPMQSFATHSMGSDMTYECMGNGSYKIRVSFYRDCSGIQAPPAVFVNASSASCNLRDSVILFPIPGTGQDITPLCPSDTSTCHGGSYTGIQEWVYEGIISFSAQCPDWQLVYEQCCRNGAITTINAPLGEEMLIYSNLNNTISPCNNSPTFSNKPVPFVCQGQQFCFNHGAFDADGDSLVYEVVTPLSYNAQPVQYYAPYNPYQPLNSVPPMTLDLVTGDFCITPQSPEVTVMAILVHEFRNGVEIGAIERDIQVTVIPCTNDLPTMTGINGTNSFSATICANSQFCFDAFSNDPNVGQNLTVVWNQAIPGAVFNAPSAAHPTGTFCWTPTLADVSTAPHCFTVQVTDDACPLLGSQTYSYCLTVTKVTVNAGPDKTIACGGTTNITATTTNLGGNVTYQWNNGPTTLSQNVGPGTYIITASNGQCSASDTVVVSITSGPTAAFSVSPSCVNSPLTFTDMSTVAGTGTLNSWNWNFNDGGTSTLQSPSHQYTSPGNYNVCLYVNTNQNCPDTVCQIISVNSLPVASFNATNTCLGPPTSVVNNTTPLGINYSWDFGNGTTSGAASPTVTYANPGNYTITLIATDAAGCKDTIQQNVNVYPPPVAGFNAAIVDPCQGGLINLTDASSAGTTGWNWNFGNGQTSAQQNPSTTLSPGSHTILLTTTDANGCTDTVTQQITINPPFIANFGPAQTICPDGTATITASGGVSYLWSNGQTGPSISVSPTASTTYTVSVTDANNCTVTGQVAVNVNPAPLVNAGPDQTACTGTTINLNATGANSFSWSTGANSAGISVSPTTQTTYTVIGTDSNGCISSDEVVVNINPLLAVNLANPFVCPGNPATLDAGYPGASYLWNNGLTTQTISVSSAGNYSVTVTDANGCTGIGLSTVTVGGAGLVNNATTAHACSGMTRILDAGNPGNHYLWSTGDTTQTIQVNTSGSYNVTVTDTDGCSITFTSNFLNNPLPVPAFSSVPVCLNDSNIFLNTSAVSSGGIVSYAWDFGDGSASALQAPSHLFAANGTYNVTLTTTTDSGCVENIVQQITVRPLLTVSLANKFICPGSQAVLDAGYPGYSYVWSTGETTQTISVDSAATYSVTVTDANGCTGSSQSTLTVGGGTLINNPMSADACSGQQANLDAGNPGNHYLWSTGDTTQTIAVNAAGNYNVVVTDADGCTISFTSNVVINPLPTVAFSATSVCQNDSNIFSNTSTVASGAITNYQWNFGDGSTSTLSNTNHSYSGSGSYTVSLTATTDSGCVTNLSKPVTVYPLPVAAFQNNSVCLGDTTSFTSLSNVANDTLNFWNWNFGDGSNSNSENPYHVYQTFGTFPVQLITATQHGCYDTISNTVTVNSIPSAAAGPDAVICSDNQISLGVPAVNGVTYDWSPATNLSPSNTSVTNFTYHNTTDNPIDFTYTVTATNQFGCKQTDEVKIKVKPLPPLTFSAPTAQCLDGNLFIFIPTGTLNSNTSLNWNFGAGSNPGTSSSLSSVSVNYSTIGLKPVSLSYSYMGCPGPATIDTVNVLEMPLAGFLPSPFEGCASLDVTFYNTHPNNNYQYTWQIQGQILHDEKPSWTFEDPGTYRVTQVVTNEYGCVSQPAIANVKVYPVPQAAFTNTPDSSWIFQSVIEFENNSIDGAQYQWDFGDGSTADFFNGTHAYSDTGTFDITLIVISDHGCLDTIQGKVKIYEGFSFYVPNAFSPNNDGVNDAFQGYGTYIHSYEMWIYDRWGLVLYHTNDYDKPWDGRIHTMAQNDTYVYRIKVTDFRDKDHIFIGSVTLVK